MRWRLTTAGGNYLGGFGQEIPGGEELLAVEQVSGFFIRAAGTEELENQVKGKHTWMNCTLAASGLHGERTAG